MLTEEKLLTAKMLSVRWNGKPSVTTLASWRHKKKGPPYVKMGGVKYKMSDIVKYENGLRSKI